MQPAWSQPSLIFRAAPSGEVLQDSLLSLTVAPLLPGAALPDSCGIYRSPVPAGNRLAGHAARVAAAASVPPDGIGRLFRVRPSDSGASGPKLGLGFHYVVAACSDSSVTPEIPILVVSRQAASITTPKALEASSSPDISWTPVPGVPAYHLLLSDQALEIDAGKGTVGGASIIWQAITTRTSIAYGTPDPSGNFAKVGAPPLSPGVTYNLVVLNNYDGRSALATSSKAQALKLFSIQSPASPLSKPRNLAPAQGRSLGVSADSSIAFRWTASRSAAGAANTYKLYIYSRQVEEGAEVLVPIFSAEVTDTSLVLDAKRTLLDARYVWKVFARSEAGTSVVGDTTSFLYRNDVQTLSLNVTGPGPAGGTVPLGDVRIEVAPQGAGGGADALPLFTPSSGRVDKVLAVGGYSLVFSKDGFVTQRRAVTLDASGPLSVDQPMPAAAGRITGKAVDAGGLPLDNVRVTAASADREVSALTDFQGAFLLGVAAGSHAVSFAKADYASPPDTVVALQAGQAADLGQVALSQPKGSLAGTVRNDKGQPLAGCEVLVRTPAGAHVRTLLTDDKGGFSAYLAPGSYAVSASRPGFTAEEKSVRLTDAASLAFQLVPGASVLKGRAYLKSWPAAGSPVSVPLPGASLELREVFSGSVRKAGSDLRGEYSFSADTGTYLLRVSHPGKAPPESSLVKIAKARSTLDKDVELRGFASVQGTLGFSPSPPSAPDPSSIRVNLLRLPSLELAASAPAFASGPGGATPAFSVENVPDGTYRVACGFPGYGLDAEPTVTVRDGVWITGLALALRQASKSVTFLFQHAPAAVPGSVRLAAPRQAELRAGDKLGPAASGTYVLDATPDSLPLLPLSRFSFLLPSAGAADTTVRLSFPFVHEPPSGPLAFRNQAVELVLKAPAPIDSAWVVYGYGAPADTFRAPASMLGGQAGGAVTLRFNPGPQGGLLTYFFILRSGPSRYANDAPARRFRTRIAPSRDLAFLRITGGDSLPLPARSRVVLDVHAYDAAGRRLDTAVDARGKVTWDAGDISSAVPKGSKGRALTLATGAAPAPGAAALKRAAGKRGGAFSGASAGAWGDLAVTVSLDGIQQTLRVPAKVVAARVNRLVLASALGETPAIPSPAPFGLFVSAFDTTTSPPTPLVPAPAFALDPPEAGTVRDMEVLLDPRFIGPLRVLATHVNGDGSSVSTELGAGRDSSLRGVNVGQTLRPADSARLFVHDRQFELFVPDSALLAGSGGSGGQAVLRVYRRQVAKSFSSGLAESVAGRLHEVSNPSGAAFGKALRLNLGVPAPFRGRDNALRRFETASLAWEAASDSAAPDTTAFGEASLSAGITLLDGNYYGILGRSRPLSAGSLEIVPNPFSPLVMATRDGNIEHGTRIRFRPESDRSAEVTVSIRIYNMDGELVRTLVDHKTVPKALTDFYWDGRAEGGRWVRNGRYLVKITLNATGSRETRHLVKPVVVFR